MARMSILLLVALVAFGVADARRPPPAKRSPPPPSPRPPPPPSPSPSPPPPPPSRYVFPHSCNPGNLPFSAPKGTDCTPYELQVVEAGVAGTDYKFRVAYKPVDPEVCGGSLSCANMPLNDVKFSINPECRGAFTNLKVTNATGTYGWSFQYASETYPKNSGVSGPAMTARVIFNKVPGGFLASGAAADGIEFSFKLNKAVCTNTNTWRTAVGTYLYQYGYWDDKKKCCGQGLAAQL